MLFAREIGEKRHHRGGDRSRTLQRAADDRHPNVSGGRGDEATEREQHEADYDNSLASELIGGHPERNLQQALRESIDAERNAHQQLIRATIEAEPDKLADRLTVGPRVFVSLETLRSSGLIDPGSLVTWRYALKLGDGAGQSKNGLVDFTKKAKEALPEGGFTIRVCSNLVAFSLKRHAERR